MSEFVEGWSILQILGEGGYGEVKLLYNRNTGSAVAMKTIDLIKHAQKITEVRREAYIHNLLSHENIIRYYGQRQERNFVYMFLEYASGGDLFDLIEPDIGMPQSQARSYFVQLISGVEYLHSKGIAHRDLKPENLLLDGNGTLKISDFGLATIFRHQNKERLLQKQCGTLQYIAPEIFMGPYAAEPADIWSCGIILIAMLAGELPWIRADNECPMYMRWRKKQAECINDAPWSKISKSAFSIIERILNLNPVKRYTILNTKAHRWCKLQSNQSACFSKTLLSRRFLQRRRSVYFQNTMSGTE